MSYPHPSILLVESSLAACSNISIRLSAFIGCCKSFLCLHLSYEPKLTDIHNKYHFKI